MIRKTLVLAALLLCTLGFAKSPIHYVVATPGEDASSQISVNWHSFEPGSYLEIKNASAKDFARALKVIPQQKLWSLDPQFVSDSLFTRERYVCSVRLEGLMRNHKYEYRVVCGDWCSPVYSFQTASGRSKWTFAAFTDFQPAGNDRTHAMIEKVISYSGREIPLVVCSGDMVDYSAVEKDWEWVLDNALMGQFVFASSPGDHEYWGTKMPNGHISQLPMPEAYNSMFTFPANGLDERKNSSFWFRYNNILFVALDMGDSNTSKCEMFDRETEWFTKTIQALKGTYTYLVVLEHKGIFGSYESDSVVAKNLRPLWAPVFREAGVDLVLCGHDHMFHRSVPIAGTTYLGMGTSGKKRRVPDTGLYNDGLQAKVINLPETDQCMGALVEVDSKCLKVTVIDLSGSVVDSFRVERRR